MGISRDQTHNEGFPFKRRPDMLPTEAINRIRVLSERGMGSKAIAKTTGISSVARQHKVPTNRQPK